MSTKMGQTTAAMTSFNYIGNVWAGANSDLLQTVLRDEWGFEGVTVSDWFSGNKDGYMLADSAIRVGGDKMLSSQGDPKAYVSNTDSPATVTAMRNAAHNILYSAANSNAIDERNFQTPGCGSGNSAGIAGGVRGDAVYKEEKRRERDGKGRDSP